MAPCGAGPASLTAPGTGPSRGERRKRGPAGIGGVPIPGGLRVSVTRVGSGQVRSDRCRSLTPWRASLAVPQCIPVNPGISRYTPLSPGESRCPGAPQPRPAARPPLPAPGRGCALRSALSSWRRGAMCRTPTTAACGPSTVRTHRGPGPAPPLLPAPPCSPRAPPALPAPRGLRCPPGRAGVPRSPGGAPSAWGGDRSQGNPGRRFLRCQGWIDRWRSSRGCPGVVGCCGTER